MSAKVLTIDAAPPPPPPPPVVGVILLPRVGLDTNYGIGIARYASEFKVDGEFRITYGKNTEVETWNMVTDGGGLFSASADEIEEFANELLRMIGREHV